MDRIIVIGASQGGVQALRTVVAKLPPDFPAPILVVLHVGSCPSMLPELLSEAGPLPACHVLSETVLEAGHIYVAPPDRHLMVVDSVAEPWRGPRENWARPAIDPLFRSAAEIFGSRVIGVILSGNLNDGTPGLYEIKRRGGIAVVQDPDDAEAPSMPQSALDSVDVDFRVKLADLPDLLVRLASEPAASSASHPPPPEEHAMRADEWKLARPTAQTCPDCGGAMAEEAVGGLSRFRCHIGHVMTAEVLAAAQLDTLDKDISTVLRALNERAALCDDLADRYAARGDAAGEAWRGAAGEARRREHAIQDLIAASWAHPEAGRD